MSRLDFQGFLLSIGGNVFPEWLTNYKISPSQEQELESYIDGNGLLHTETAPHRRTKIEFTVDDIDLYRAETIVNFFPNMKSVSVTYWNDKYMSYQTGTFYISNYTLEVEYYDSSNIYYKPLSLSLIEF